MRASCRPGGRPPRPAQSRQTVLFPRINFIKQSVRAPCICLPCTGSLTRPPPARQRRPLRNRIVALQFPVHDPFSVCMPTSMAGFVMTNKRKRDADVEHCANRAKRQRRRHRSHSQPASDTGNAEKRQALKRLFGRICSVEVDNHRDEETEEEEFEEPIFGDENEDPLLDSVPVDMDPEQLGFLVCAQETLRFLHGRGIPPQHPVFARLRSRLLRGIDEMGAA